MALTRTQASQINAHGTELPTDTKPGSQASLRLLCLKSPKERQLRAKSHGTERTALKSQEIRSPLVADIADCALEFSNQDRGPQTTENYTKSERKEEKVTGRVLIMREPC